MTAPRRHLRVADDAGRAQLLAAAGEHLGAEIVDAELYRWARRDGTLDGDLTLTFADGERITANIRRFVGPRASAWLRYALLINQGTAPSALNAVAGMDALVVAMRIVDDATVAGELAAEQEAFAG